MVCSVSVWLHDGTRLEVEAEPGSGALDTFQLQLFSLTGAHPPHSQLLLADGIGLVRTDADLNSLLARDSPALVVQSLEARPDAPFWRSILGTEGAPPAAQHMAAARAQVAEACTRTWFGCTPTLQPCARVPQSDGGRPLRVCHACRTTCASAAPQPVPGAAPTPAMPAALGGAHLDSSADVFACECGTRGGGECLFAPRAGTEDATTFNGALEMVLLQLRTRTRAAAEAEAMAHTAQVAQARGAADMAGRLRSMRAAVQRYYQVPAMLKSVSTIPLVSLHARAAAAIERAHAEGVSAPAFADALLAALVHWFKHEFFSWVNCLSCERCGSTQTVNAGGAAPTPQERRGLAGVTEIHTCNACGHRTRFGRFNDCCTLLDSRKGRCGEWANCFTQCALAAGFEARHVTDWSDHVWTEVWSGAKGRWLHVDSCEAAIDTPLVYESGWGKKISYVIGVGPGDVVDVTRRYTKREADVLSRRTQVGEAWLSHAIAAADAEQLVSGAMSGAVDQRTALARALRAGDEQRELAGSVAFDDGSRQDDETSGRISGSLAWRLARDEMGGHTAAGSGAASAGSMQAADAGRPSYGWAQAASNVSDGGKVQLASASCFGAQVCAVTHSGQLVWATLPTAATRAHGTMSSAAARAAAFQWKPISVWRGDGSAVLGEGERPLAVGAASQRLAFLLLTMAVDSSACHESGTPGVRRLHLWHVRYEDAHRKRWEAALLSACALAHVMTSDVVPGTVSLALVRNSFIFLLAGGVLWRLSNDYEAAIAAAEARCATWERVADAPHVSHLTPLPCGALAGVVSSIPPTEPSAAVTHSMHVAVLVPSRLRLNGTCVSVLPGVGELHHAWSNCDAARSNDVPSHSVRLKLDPHYQSSLYDWLVWARPGTNPYACWRRGVCVHSHSTQRRSDSSVEVRLPDDALPTERGAYELRYYRGAGFDDLAAVSPSLMFVGAPPVCDSSPRPAPHTWWCPLAPASNVRCLLSTPTALVALTTSDDAWMLHHARQLLGSAPASDASVAPSLCDILQAAQLGMAEGVAPRQAARAAEDQLAPSLGAARMPTEAIADALPAAPAARATDAAAGEVAVATVWSTLAPPQRVRALLRQVSHGCGAARGTCTHAFCASNASVPALSGTPAAIRAVELAARTTSEAVCPNLRMAA